MSNWGEIVRGIGVRDVDSGEGVESVWIPSGIRMPRRGTDERSYPEPAVFPVLYQSGALESNTRCSAIPGQHLLPCDRAPSGPVMFSLI